jgi:hypothetical protein
MGDRARVEREWSRDNRKAKTMEVQIGKGITLSVDVDRLNADVTEHVLYIGLRNILMDSHASATKLGKDPRDMAVAKLESMYNGESRASGGRTTDKVVQDMRKQAQAVVDAKLKEKKLDPSKDEYKKLVAAYIAKNESQLRANAEARVAQIKESVAAVSLDDLGL